MLSAISAILACLILISPLLISIAVVIIVWIIIVLGVRRHNFWEDGSRRFFPRGKTVELRSNQVEWKNNAIYQAFSFYFKTTLAIFGGIAYIFGHSDKYSKEVFSFILSAAAWLEVFTAFIFGAMIITHMKSKIERWEKRYTFFQTFTWVEFWMILGMVIIAGITILFIIPHIKSLPLK